ncbi:hypothetical protein TraAM80_02974 [Trypanosoma rangeli]|uniref:Uncharacterized protein n=1 Tax=Trypanosoma rangeli TaxID=5698 RepID=A0A422NRB5_TRYRA|nr:uncharacterized protein TraAM80_02974 [Trypanosoma rangeli]RNF08040.1 hypothetical protein TraAM80_02974 [Trypanosoma rangeli]|eukprot:RNF08040.1 hypothetical protein TraAM80_02974 [Trypanosoma rangeli]
MEEESFTYVLSPATTTQECVHRVAEEKLPSLAESMEFAAKTGGTLFIDCEGLIDDVLLSFCRVSEGVNGGRAHAPPGGGFLPATTAPHCAKSGSSAPAPFQAGAWLYVWEQFQRDIARETLIIDGTPCSDAYAALERIKRLLSDAYDAMPARFISAQTWGSAEEHGDGGLRSQVSHAVRGLLGDAQRFCKKVWKKGKLDEAVRTAILVAQQAVMAFPVELLHAQFGGTSQAGAAGGDDAGSEVIYIGEPYLNSPQGDGGTAPSTGGESRRMVVRVERRNQGRGPAFVRVEKFMHVFAVDGSANVSTKLQLWIVIELGFFTNDKVELKWEWLRAPGPSPAPNTPAPETAEKEEL